MAERANKKKILSNLEITRKMRKVWDMNPRTRVKESKLKDVKKRRQKEKEIIIEE